MQQRLPPRVDLARLGRRRRAARLAARGAQLRSQPLVLTLVPADERLLLELGVGVG